MHKAKRYLIYLLKFSFAGALIAFLIRSGRLDLRSLIELENPAFVGTIISLFFCAMLLGLGRWYVLLRAVNVPMDLRVAMHIGLIAYGASIILPSTGGIEGVRLFYSLPRCRAHQHAVACSILMDRLIALIGLCVTACALGSLLLAVVGGASLSLTVLGGAATTIVLSAALAALISPRIKNWIGPRWKTLHKLAEAFADFRQKPFHLLWAAALSVGCQLMSAAAFYFAFRALGIAPPFIKTISVVPLINLSGAVPLAPMGLGVSDFVSALLYESLQIVSGAEVMMLIRLCSAVALLFGGLAYLAPIQESSENCSSAAEQSTCGAGQ